MSPTFEARYLLVLALVVAGIGTVDAALSREWDLLAMLGALDVLLAGLGLRVFGPRPAVRLRPDLVAWLRRRAAETGDSLESVADRAVATYRDRLSPPAGTWGEQPESRLVPPETGRGAQAGGGSPQPEAGASPEPAAGQGPRSGGGGPQRESQAR